MRLYRIFLPTLLAVIGFGMLNEALADGIPVGSSSLIRTLDYSDTFTTNAYRIAGDWPIADVANAAAVENCHGNASRSWAYTLTGVGAAGFTTFGSFATDNNYAPGYPGGSNAGSNTGFTQNGSIGADFGIAYGLRTNYVVQFDAVQTLDRVDITTGDANDSIGSAHGLSVFFRKTGSAFGEVGLYNASAGVGEKITGIQSGISDAKTWHNYAVHFNFNTGTLGIYTDQVLRGTIDLKSAEYASYWNIVDPSSNAYVSVGGSHGTMDILWVDNFQVGAVPEPSVCILLSTGLLGLAAYVWRKRR